MDAVWTAAEVENLRDCLSAEAESIPPGEVRRVAIPGAVVDPRLMLVALPTRTIRDLGLERTGGTRRAGSIGLGDVAMYDPVRLTIQGRTCTMDVMEVPDEMPASIGRLPILHLDLVVNEVSRTLTGNPAHDGEHIYELY